MLCAVLETVSIDFLRRFLACFVQTMLRLFHNFRVTCPLVVPWRCGVRELDSTASVKNKTQEWMQKRNCYWYKGCTSNRRKSCLISIRIDSTLHVTHQRRFAPLDVHSWYGMWVPRRRKLNSRDVSKYETKGTAYITSSRAPHLLPLWNVILRR